MLYGYIHVDGTKKLNCCNKACDIWCGNYKHIYSFEEVKYYNHCEGKKHLTSFMQWKLYDTVAQLLNYNY
jgi:hypothetical protein